MHLSCGWYFEMTLAAFSPRNNNIPSLFGLFTLFKKVSMVYNSSAMATLGIMAGNRPLPWACWLSVIIPGIHGLTLHIYIYSILDIFTMLVLGM